MKVKTIVIGYGFLGRWHAQKAAALNELCELKAIIETFPEAIKRAKDVHPHVPVLSDWKAIKDEFDTAIVVTPTSLHYEVCHELLTAGKNVFCEKPLCSTSDEAKKLDALALKNSLTLQVGHSERCHGAWESLRSKFLDMNGALSLKIDRYASFKGRATDVDVVQDLMIHDIDLMLWLFGRKVKSIEAIGHKIRTQHWDHVTAIFYLENGMKAFITSGRNHVEEVRALEVMHSTGAVKVDLFHNKIHVAPNSEISPNVFTHTSNYEKRDHLLIEQDSFYQSILNHKPVLVSGAEGVRAVELVEKVLIALDSGKSVVCDG